MKTINLKIIYSALMFCAVMLIMAAIAPPAFAAAAVQIGSKTLTAGKTYTYYTGAEQHTQERTYDPTSPYSVSLDASGSVLTLNDATILSAVEITGNITIEVNGINTVTDHDPDGQALNVTGLLTFTSTGSLTVNGYDSNSNWESSSVAINCTKTIFFNEATITANGGSRMSDSGPGGSGGVIAGGITVNSGVVKINGGDTNIAAGSAGDGLRLSGSGIATINGGDLDILGGSGTGSGASGGNGIFGGSVNIIGGDVYIKGGDCNGNSYGGNGVNFSSVTISGGTSVTIEGGNGQQDDGGNGVDGNVTISTTTTPISITGGDSIDSDPNPTGSGGHGVQGNVITPTGTIGAGTNIIITGGTGGLSHGQAYTGTLSQPTPTPTPTPTPQTPPVADVIYTAERTSTANGVYTFTSSGPYSSFTGVWVNGSAIPSTNYTAVQSTNGTVAITFTNLYAKTLNLNEEYLLHFVFNGGFGIVNFTKDAAALALTQGTVSTSSANSEAASQEETQGTEDEQAANFEETNSANTDDEQAANSEAQITSQPEEDAPSSAETTDVVQAQEEQTGIAMIMLIAALAIVCIGGGVLIFVRARKK